MRHINCFDRGEWTDSVANYDTQAMEIKPWTVYAVILAAFVAGSLFVAADEVGTNTDRLFELRVYHVLPGKMPALEARFRDTTSKLLAKHELKVVGYWVGDDNTFVFLVAHTSK